jgi:hypothetical protein
MPLEDYEVYPTGGGSFGFRRKATGGGGGGGCGCGAMLSAVLVIGVFGFVMGNLHDCRHHEESLRPYSTPQIRVVPDAVDDVRVVETRTFQRTWSFLFDNDAKGNRFRVDAVISFANEDCTGKLTIHHQEWGQFVGVARVMPVTGTFDRKLCRVHLEGDRLGDEFTPLQLNCSLSTSGNSINGILELGGNTYPVSGGVVQMKRE